MKTKQLNLRLSEDEEITLKTKALEHGMTTSQYLRARILDAVAAPYSAQYLSTSELAKRAKAAETIIKAQSLAQMQDTQWLRRGECLSFICKKTDEIADYIIRYQAPDSDEVKTNDAILAMLQHLQNLTIGDL